MVQLNELEFPLEEDFNGLDCENSILRRLYRILNLPTSDFLHKRAIKDPKKNQ